MIGPKWGVWSLDLDTLTLTAALSRGQTYAIELNRCLTAAQVLDWVMQIGGKSWRDEALSDFIDAIRDTVHPQGGLCSFAVVSGRPGSVIELDDLRSVVERNVRRWAEARELVDSKAISLGGR